MNPNTNKDKKIMKRVFVIALAMFLAATIISTAYSLQNI